MAGFVFCRFAPDSSPLTSPFEISQMPHERRRETIAITQHNETTDNVTMFVVTKFSGKASWVALSEIEVKEKCKKRFRISLAASFYKGSRIFYLKN